MVRTDIILYDHKAEVVFDRGLLTSVRTLGVLWSADSYMFAFKENAPHNAMVYINRNVLKKTISLFDRMGSLFLVRIRTRLFLKNTWTAGLEKEDGLTEPAIMLACSGLTAICELTKGGGNEATGRQRIWRCLKNEDNTRDSDTMSLHAFTANAYDDILNALVHVEVRLKSLQQVITVISGTFGELVTSRQGQGKYRKKRCTGLFVCLVTRAKGLEIAFDRKTTCSSFMTVFVEMDNHRELTKEMSFEDWTDLISAKQEHESFRSQFDGTHIDESIANESKLVS